MTRNLQKRFKRRQLALSLAALSAAIATSPVTLAQEDEAEIEEISVTGSRIQMTSGMTTPVPVTSLTTDELFDFAPGNTISEQLDALPQFFDTKSPQRGDGGRAVVGSGATGSLDLRNLSAGRVSRTLVLLDGARVVPTDKRGNINIDLFPTALVRSVDVVTGGASAAYGADAVGGVVNFVLDREFDGLEFKVGAGVQEEDMDQGQQWEFSIAGGRGFFDDRLHLIGSLESREIDEIQPDPDRWDNFQRWGHITNPEWSRGAPPGVPQRLTLPMVAPSDTSPTGLMHSTGTALDMMKFTLDGSAIVPFEPGVVSARRDISGGPEAEIYHLTADGGPEGAEAISRSGFLGAQYQITPALSIFLQGMAGRTESNDHSSNAYFRADGIFAPLIAVDNAFLPQEVRDIMIANGLDEVRVHKTAAQFPGRPEIGSDFFARNVHTQWQWSWGVDWSLAQGWDLRASWQRGQAHRNSQGYNVPQVDRFFLGMDAVRHPDTGEIVCRVNLFNPTLEELAASVEGLVSSRPLNPYEPAGVEGNTQPLTAPVDPASIRECVPYNVLGSGNMSQAAIEYVGTTKVKESYVDQDFAEAIVTGDLFTLPAGPVNIAAGLTWRDQQFIDTALPIAIDLLGPPINTPELGIRGIGTGFDGGSGNLHLFSTVPYIGGQTDVWEWFGEVNVPVWASADSQRLSVSGAFRRSDYDRSGTSDSWKLGIDFQVFNDLRFRATKSRDVREPNFSELFDRQGSGATVDDPRFNGETFFTSGIRGGNPDLRPEKADTNAFGFVYQPSFVPWLEGFSLSLDWWDVQISDAISQLGSQRILNECEIEGVQSFCSLIVRDPETQFITRINAPFLNLAEAAASGVDLEVQWSTEPDFATDLFETFRLRLLAGYMGERSDTAFGGTAEDVADTVGNPDLTANLSADYGIGPYSIQIQGRFIDSVRLRSDWIEGIDVDDNTVASSTWWNARFGYNGEFGNGSSWTLGFNIQNIFDRDPPILGGSSYDQYGRRYNLSFNYSF